MTIHLPDNYNFVSPGLSSIEHECPWMTPESIHFLDTHLKSSYKILEIGSGGSTLFFARRCDTVVAYELDEQYYHVINEAISTRNLKYKVDLHLVPPQDLMHTLESLSGSFDVISIDHGVHLPNRSDCLDAVMHMWTGKILVMDNWAKRKAWPKHKGKTPEWYIKNYPVCEGCDFHEFGYDGWAGKGTKVIINQKLI